MIELSLGGITMRVETALIDGQPGEAEIARESRDGIERLTVRTTSAAPLLSIGLRFTVTGAAHYLRNGYHSWDGSWFAEAGTVDSGESEGKQPSLGFAMTTVLPRTGDGAVVIGFERHDRFQSRFRFGGTAEAMMIDVETLLDRTGTSQGETLLLFASESADAGIDRWLDLVVATSPLPPRNPPRITGWCSWYNHYAEIDEATIRQELDSCVAFRDRHRAPLDVFLIDDGFTPEMGDWLLTRPTFPNGMKPILREVAQAGFIPGLWIAPFLVGNRSVLFRDHPEWVVRDPAGEPLAAMHFYGEFRWHKRSEEYYLLDVTHPDAASHIAGIFRVWAHDWGVRYFKTDFMFYPFEYGPDRAVWYEAGLSRVAIWRRMAAIVRDAIGDVLWLGCGFPLWASIGLTDAVRIGRDIGVDWNGEYGIGKMRNDLSIRGRANGKLWQADPDCLLLRNRFHTLTDRQIEERARLAASVDGVLMTSDTLTELPEARQALFAELLE